MSFNYNPNPKHGEGVGRGIKGTRLDIHSHDAMQLLNDPFDCFPAGPRHRVGVKNGKIYVFHNEGNNNYHAFPISGNELCSRYSSVKQLVATKLGISVKKLSQMY